MLSLNYTKLLAGLGLAAALAVGWLVDRHYQYEAGKKWCQEQAAEQTIKQIPEAIKRAEKTTDTLNKLNTDKANVQNEFRDEAIKAQRPTSCDLSDGELLKFNELLNQKP